MSYIGNEPVSQSTRLVYEETVTVQGKQTFTPPGGYTVGQLDVEVNGSGLGAQDFTATDGVTVTLAVGCGIGDLVKIVAWGNFTLANINGAAIIDGTVGTAELANSAVTTAKIADASITGAKLAPGAVSNAYVGVNAQIFTANGTFTVPAGVTALKVTVVGGGAAGGGAAAANNLYNSGGGGAGGAAIKYLTGLTSGATLSVTVGAGGAGVSGGNGGSGGTSSVASGTQTISTISATGGTGGGFVTVGNTLTTVAAGGVGSGGDINIRGGYGSGMSTVLPNSCLTNYYISGYGGAVGASAALGFHNNGASYPYAAPNPAVGMFGGTGGFLPSAIVAGSGITAGVAGSGYGNGGSGTLKQGSTAAAAGAAGAAGVVIFEW